LHWCEGQGIGELARVQPVHVAALAAYIELLQGERSAPTVKQHLACIRMPFDWLVTGRVMPSNAAHSVRGPRHSVSKGSTPVLSSEEATALHGGMDVSSVVGLRDRALIAVMTYTFARAGAVVTLNVEDYFPQKKRWWLRLQEKNGKVRCISPSFPLQADPPRTKAGLLFYEARTCFQQTRTSVQPPAIAEAHRGGKLFRLGLGGVKCCEWLGLAIF
jgi:integrase/recombinase XerD